MNERDTPETNAFYATFADGLASPSQDEWLERLKRFERQRDGLLEALRRFAELDLSGTDDSLVRFIVLAHQNNAEHAIAAVKEGKP
jgi:hypothetical protein